MRKKLIGGGAVVACLAASGIAFAGINAVPGDNCQVNSGTAWTVVTGSSSTQYQLVYPAHFRVVDYGSTDTYYGHGNNQPDGYIVRAAINQSTCA